MPQQIADKKTRLVRQRSAFASEDERIVVAGVPCRRHPAMSREARPRLDAEIGTRVAQLFNFVNQSIGFVVQSFDFQLSIVRLRLSSAI
eukprot:10702570-Lingulodinium_polyedra.AAC.1